MKKSLSPFLLEFLFKLLLIQPEVNHNSIQSFHLNPFNHQIQESAAAKAYDAEWKWMNSSEAKQRSDAAKAQALSDFKKRFPHAQMSRFQVQVEFDANRKALGRVLFPDGNGSWENPLIEDQKYWSPALRSALGAQQDGGFPYQLSLLQQNKPPPHPVPAIAFSNTTGQSIADLFNKQVKIYVTPTDYFTTKFRQIFTKTQIKFTQAKYARKWLAKPDMSFWPQQLNFALWCATTGCGVSREMLFSNSSLQLSDQSEKKFKKDGKVWIVKRNFSPEDEVPICKDQKSQSLKNPTSTSTKKKKICS